MIVGPYQSTTVTAVDVSGKKIGGTITAALKTQNDTTRTVQLSSFVGEYLLTIFEHHDWQIARKTNVSLCVCSIIATPHHRPFCSTICSIVKVKSPLPQPLFTIFGKTRANSATYIHCTEHTSRTLRKYDLSRAQQLYQITIRSWDHQAQRMMYA